MTRGWSTLGVKTMLGAESSHSCRKRFGVLPRVGMLAIRPGSVADRIALDTCASSRDPFNASTCIHVCMCVCAYVCMNHLDTQGSMHIHLHVVYCAVYICQDCMTANACIYDVCMQVCMYTETSISDLKHYCNLHLMAGVHTMDTKDPATTVAASAGQDGTFSHVRSCAQQHPRCAKSMQEALQY